MLSSKPSFSVRRNLSSFSASVSSLWFIRHCFLHASVKVDCLLGKYCVHRPIERETATQKSKHTTTHPHLTQTKQWTVLQWKCHRSQSLPSILRKPFQSLSFEAFLCFSLCFYSKEIFPDQRKKTMQCAGGSSHYVLSTLYPCILVSLNTIPYVVLSMFQRISLCGFSMFFSESFFCGKM